MPAPIQRARSVQLLPVAVFAAIATILLALLLRGGIEWLELAWRLALGLGLAAAAAVACTLVLDRRTHRGRHDETSDAARELARSSRGRLDLLTREREHLLTVLDSMSEGVLVADADGRSVIVNPSWRELFGVTGEAEGRTALELTRQTALDRMVSETLATGRGRQAELDVTRGRRRTVVLTSSPLTDGAGVVVLARDLTPLLRVGQIRRDFVANVSHELKTPLSALRGFAETLRDGALEEREAAERFLDRMLRQCQRLETLLSDLLTLSRLEDPSVRSGWAEVDLAAVVAEAAELTAESAEEREVGLSVDLQPVPRLAGDAEALMRLCVNLLENAIKYNRPRGRVEVRLARAGDRILLEVADTGIGIAPESIERLFERFYRVDKGRSRHEGGTGLGLAIVKHAAQLHGGTVEVESELGKGSRFRVLLPLDAAPSPAVEPEQPVSGL